MLQFSLVRFAVHL